MRHALHTTRAFSPWFLGWGLLTAWGLVSLALEAPPVPGGLAVVNAVTSAAALGGLGLLAVLVRLRPRLVADVGAQSRGAAWGPALFMAAASLGNQTLQAVDPALVLAAVVLQVLSSFAYVGLMALWFMSYAVRDPQVVERGAIWSTVVCAAVVAPVHLLPQGAAVTVWVLLPLASAACLVRVGTSAAVEPPRAPSEPVGGAVSLRTFAGIAVCALVLGLPPNLMSGIPAASAGLLQLGSLGGVMLAAVLVLGYTAATRRIGLRSLLGWLQPMAAVGLFCAALPAAPAAVAGIMLASAGQWALYVFVWIYAAEAPGGGLARTLGAYLGARAAFDVGGALAALFGWGLTVLVGADTVGGLLAYLLFGAVVLLVVGASLGIPLGPAAKGVVERAPAVPRSGQTLDGLVGARAALVAGRYGLSEREAQILVRLLKGYSTAAVRNELGIAKGTVDTYISRIYRKCSVHGRQELVELAERQEVDGAAYSRT